MSDDKFFNKVYVIDKPMADQAFAEVKLIKEGKSSGLDGNNSALAKQKSNQVSTKANGGCEIAHPHLLYSRPRERVFHKLSGQKKIIGKGPRIRIQQI